MTIANLPRWTEEIPNKDEMYAGFWIATALVKMQEYANRGQVYANRHHLSFKEFEHKVLFSGKENFSEWDDYIVWKGLEEARSIWSRRYEELRQCAI